LRLEIVNSTLETTLNENECGIESFARFRKPSSESITHPANVVHMRAVPPVEADGAVLTPTDDKDASRPLSIVEMASFWESRIGQKGGMPAQSSSTPVRYATSGTGACAAAQCWHTRAVSFVGQAKATADAAKYDRTTVSSTPPKTSTPVGSARSLASTIVPSPAHKPVKGFCILSRCPCFS
jgi:hypothetical protein